MITILIDPQKRISILKEKFTNLNLQVIMKKAQLMML
jgi:hypothetical protein